MAVSAPKRCDGDVLTIATMPLVSTFNECTSLSLVCVQTLYLVRRTLLDYAVLTLRGLYVTVFYAVAIGTENYGSRG